ncbi:MAG: dihydrofolate reductase family protein [Chitinophagaceae bacterium]
MRKLKLLIQTSIDGFIATKDGSTNWMIWNWGDDWKWDPILQQDFYNITTSVDCVLISRQMAEEGFVGHWEKMSENTGNSQAPFAKHIADIPKIVFSKTLKQSTWKNTVLSSDPSKTIAQLKQQPGKDIIVYGGATLASFLIRKNLVDEYNLLINPVILGKGMPVFSGVKTITGLSLVSTTAYSCGVSLTVYNRE